MQKDIQNKEVLKTRTTPDAPQKTHPAYTLVFIILAVLTALEVAVSYLPHDVKVPILVMLAAAKATLVLLFFMHLKYDLPIFAAPLLIGLILALPIILIIVLVMPML